MCAVRTPLYYSEKSASTDFLFLLFGLGVESNTCSNPGVCAQRTPASTGLDFVAPCLYITNKPTGRCEVDYEQMVEEEFAAEVEADRAASEYERRQAEAEAFHALVREDYEPNPYDGTYSEM